MLFRSQVFTQFFPQSVEAAYTFNAPGFGGALAQLVDFFFPTSLDIQSSLVTNYVADHGFDVTARLGVLVGDTQRIFNESGGNPVDNHFMEKLTDSLSVYNLLSQVDPSMSLRVIGGILDSTSNVASRSLETAVDSLRALVRPGIALPATEIGDRTGLNAVVVDLLRRLPDLAGASTLGVQSLQIGRAHV